MCILSKSVIQIFKYSYPKYIFICNIMNINKVAQIRVKLTEQTVKCYWWKLFLFKWVWNNSFN